jgi:hypothetical protein
MTDTIRGAILLLKALSFPKINSLFFTYTLSAPNQK